MGNARQFLGTLSAKELDAVRQNHCLADPIDTGSLSEEGAENPLLPEGYSVGLNHDGIDEALELLPFVVQGRGQCFQSGAFPLVLAPGRLACLPFQRSGHTLRLVS